MAEPKAGNFGVWKKPSNNSRKRSYRDGKPKDTRLLFREREVAKSESRHKDKHNNELYSKDRRSVHSHKRTEEEDSHRHRYRRSPSLRKYDSREGKVAAKTRRDSNDEVSDKRSKKHKCKHRRQHEEEKTVVEQLVVSNNDDKIKKCRHTHRHRHHKKCKHRHLDEKQSSPPKTLSVEVRNNEHFSPSRMQKPSERIKSNAHLDVTPLDSKEIYAEGDKIFVNVNFCKPAINECEGDISEAKELCDKSAEKLNAPLPGVSSEINAIISKPGDPPKKDVKLVSKSKTEFDIFWDDNSEAKSMKSNGNDNETDASVSTNGIAFDTSPKKKTEHDFLPRSLLTEVKGLSLKTNPVIAETAFATTPPHTPPNTEDPKSVASSLDQTMPTPTQDESQVDSLKDNSNASISNSINSPVTPLSSSVASPKGRVADIYDPEAPLENTDDKFDSKAKNGAKSDVPRCNSSPVKRVFSPERTVTDVLKSRVPTKTTPVKAPKLEKPNVFSSHVTSTTVSTTSTALTNLMRLLPQPVLSSQSSAQNTSFITNKQLVHQQPKAICEQQQLHQLLQTASSITSLLKNFPVTNQSSTFSKAHHNHDVNEVVDMDVDSPHSPPASAPITSTTNKSGIRGSFLTSNPAMKPVIDQLMKAVQMKQTANHKTSANHTEVSNATFKRPIPSESTKRYRGESSVSLSSKSKHQNHGHHSSVKTKFSVPSDPKNVVKRTALGMSGPSSTTVKLGDVAVADDVPSSAVELLVKEKVCLLIVYSCNYNLFVQYLKKLNRQERVVEEVKLVLKPYYQRREVTKDEYKEILRKSVPKICHSKTGEINPVKIKQLVEEYIKRVKHLRKKSKIKSSSTATGVAKL
ncbi:PHD and RING finger domain-containing protein 1-like protein [Leptotrombidium deliense]|uniref:PHD and RING finger domain-containing protein 1-like protein n=1 Tax=Leptotrombidium deliense TaxID=299467 RepID=A0A443S7Z7_9ACAR|nr:PHD and RING finger domain-containing protein 1-like protein [Leptotrombidium deliense]